MTSFLLPAQGKFSAWAELYFSVLAAPFRLSSRVSGGTFTLPSLGTVLDSLPSHGSSYLTLLFKLLITSFISICKVADMRYTHTSNERTFVCCVLHIQRANHGLCQVSSENAYTYASPILTAVHSDNSLPSKTQTCRISYSNSSIH